MNTKLIILAIAGAVPASIFGFKKAIPDEAATQVELRIMERAQGETVDSSTTLVLPIVGKNCAEIDTHGTATEYDVKLCSQNGDARSPIVRVSIGVVGHRPGSNAVSLKASARLEPGKESPVGSIIEGDGTKLTVFARPK
jgi:hypothetical protein